MLKLSAYIYILFLYVSYDEHKQHNIEDINLYK